MQLPSSRVGAESLRELAGFEFELPGAGFMIHCTFKLSPESWFFAGKPGGNGFGESQVLSVSKSSSLRFCENGFGE